MKLFYRKSGEGHPFIILHGLYGSSDNWVSISRKLSEYFEVYLIDQRNHGNSPHHDEHTIPALSTDLLEFMEEHSIKKATISGHSMGGKVAMNFALLFPQKVSNLIIVDIAPKTYRLSEKHDSENPNHLFILKALKEIDLTKIIRREEVDEMLAKSITNPQLRQFLLKNIDRKADNSLTWKINIPAIQKHLPDILKGLEQESIFNEIQFTSSPTLFIRGENSNYITDSDFALIKKYFPLAEIKTIKNAGHWLHAEQPEKFVKCILDFIF
jgi:pimeloyl-ACP methyl ester carboxylesterase